MYDISGFGIEVTLIASVTFPNGINITEYADDADPLDVPSLTINETAMGLNGDLITFSKANPLIVTLNVIPDGDNDVNLAILLEANRVGRGKTSARDEITLVIAYPNGKTTSYKAGKITEGMPGNSVASAGRLKTKAYTFNFENKV